MALAAVLALLGAGTEGLLGSEGWLLAVVAAGSALLSLVRRRLPASVLVRTAGLTPFVPGFGPLLLVVGWSSGRYIAGAGRALAAFIAAFVLNVGGSPLGPWDRDRLLTIALTATLYYLGTTLAPGLAHRYWTQRRTCCTRSRSVAPSRCERGPWWPGRRGCGSGSGSPRTCTTASGTNWP